MNQSWELEYGRNMAYRLSKYINIDGKVFQFFDKNEMYLKQI